MKNRAYVLLVGCLLGLSAPTGIWAQDIAKPNATMYTTNHWAPDTLGNHRAVVRVYKKSDVSVVNIPWRLRDFGIENRGIVIKSSDGQQVTNFSRILVNKDQGVIAFEPTAGATDYYIYFLPYKTTGGPYPKVAYPVEKNEVSQTWMSKLNSLSITKDNYEAKIKAGNCGETKFIQFECLGSFDSFYPMEVCASSNEKKNLIEKNTDKEFLLFPEDRKNSIKMFDDIPYHWAEKGDNLPFFGEADLNEYYVYQIGLWAFKKDLQNVKVRFSDLTSENGVISAKNITCFNTEGKDWLRNDMNINLNVKKSSVQPLWCGIQIPRDIKRGLYKGSAFVKANGVEREVKVSILVSDRVLVDKGDSDIYKLSRLRWLNSDYAWNDDVIKPFTALKRDNMNISCLGRKVELNRYGFPENIYSYYTEELTTISDKAKKVINAPIKFVVESQNKAFEWENKDFSFTQENDGRINWTSNNKLGNVINLTCEGKMEFDGFMEYHVTLQADKDVNLNDIRVEFPINKEASKYWMGMGHKGSYTPSKYNWKWNVKNNQEGFWIGDVNAGLHCVFRDNNYVRPLNTNFYNQKPLIIPECWNNGGRGGISFKTKGNTLELKSYSGQRTLKAGEKMEFIFLASVTPFKPIDTMKQWTDRYFHAYKPISQVVAEHANTINIHHASAINPNINYPFFRPDFMKEYIDEAHANNCKVKIYYTVRELCNRAPELYALLSLGKEIFSDGKGNGYAWLQEHLNQHYIAAWFVDHYKDAAIVNSGISRWHNFYVEGLDWLVKNVGIDGLYIDDLAFDRNTMKRVRKVLDASGREARIDLHSANQFNKSDGFINSACLYMEHMPYLDRLWLGEYFDYSAAPDYWMTEVSGLPYGMMGEMLQGGGNPWRGMVYGMTPRLYQGSEVPKYLWKVWDEFGIKQSRMIGYWVSYNPVKTSNKNVLATSFVKEDGTTMISVASWAPKPVKVKFSYDWDMLKINKETAKLNAPAITDFQEAMTLSADDSFTIEPGKGYIFILK